MKRYRISKYTDYTFKNTDWLNDEWTDFSDIGKDFHGNVLTTQEYERVENNYLSVIDEILSHLNITELVIKNFEISGIYQKEFIGKTVNNIGLRKILKKILRNECWCLFCHDRFRLRVGYDYVMYISSNMSLNSLKKICEKHELYCADYWDKFPDNLTIGQKY